MNGTDIAGYVFGEDTYCLDCIRDLFLPVGTDAASLSTEDLLDQVAREAGFNRHGQTAYSSNDFPRPIYLTDASETDFCVICGRRLLDLMSPPL